MMEILTNKVTLLEKEVRLIQNLKGLIGKKYYKKQLAPVARKEGYRSSYIKLSVKLLVAEDLLKKMNQDLSTEQLWWREVSK